MVSLKVPNVVTPAKAGVQNVLKKLDSGSRLKACRDRFRRNDEKELFQTFYESIILENPHLKS